MSQNNATPYIPLPYTNPWVYGPLAVSAALFLFVSATSNNTSFFLALNSLSNYTGDGSWAHLTVLGDTLVALTIMFAFAGRSPTLIWSGVIAALLSTLWVHGLKGPFSFPRPPAVLTADLIHVIGPALRKSSFPSGHTTTIFALAAVLSLQIRSIGWRTAILTIAILVGLSRAVVGVHWPLDIFAGAFGGWFSGVAGILLAQRLRWGVKPTAQRIFNAIMIGCAVAVIVRPDPIYDQTRVFQLILACVCLAMGGTQLWRNHRRTRHASTAG